MGYSASTTSLSPNGNQVVVGDAQGNLRWWDSEGNLIRTIKGHEARILDIRHNAKGDLLATSSEDDTAKVWDSSGIPVLILEGHASSVYTVKFSPSEEHILTASADGTARLWQKDSSLLPRITNYSSESTSFNRDGSRMLTVSQENGSVLYDSSGKVIAVLHGNETQNDRAVFSPDGTNLLAWNTFGDVMLWNIDGNLITNLKQPKEVVDMYALPTEAHYSPNGEYILTTKGRRIFLWSATGDYIKTIDTEFLNDTILYMFLSPNDRLFLVSGLNYTKIYKSSGQFVATIRDGLVYDVDFSRDGRIMATKKLSDGGVETQVWALNESGLHSITELFGCEQGDITYFKLSPDGNYISVSSQDGGVWLHNIATREATQLKECQETTNLAPFLFFSPDGQQLFVAFDTGEVEIFDLRGHTLRTLTGQSEQVNSIAFSHDERFILTSSDDGSVRLWRTDGTPLLVIPLGARREDVVWFHSFSSDGTRILSSSTAGGAYILPLERNDWLSAAACRVGRSLTEEEIRTYSIPTPLKFKYEDRQCPPVYSWERALK